MTVVTDRTRNQNGANLVFTKKPPAHPRQVRWTRPFGSLYVFPDSQYPGKVDALPSGRASLTNSLM
jgi:hypothetical protein